MKVIHLLKVDKLKYNYFFNLDKCNLSNKQHEILYDRFINALVIGRLDFT